MGKFAYSLIAHLRSVGGRAGLVNCIAAVVLCAVSGQVLALKETRKFSTTWRIYGGNSGDFDTPEAAVQAVNDVQEANYAACITQNCGTCGKNIMGALTGLGPYPSIYNGELMSRLVTSSQMTSYTPRCVINGIVYREASGPTTTQGSGGIAVVGIMRCPYGGWGFEGRSLGSQLINGQNVPVYEGYCVSYMPEPCNVCTQVGNPIDVSTGAKLAFETDYVSSDSGLSVRRTYSSLMGSWKWEHSFSLRDFTGAVFTGAGPTDLVSYVDTVPPGFYVNVPTPVPQPTAHSFPLVKTQPDSGQPEAWAFLPNQRRIRFTQAAGGSLSTADSSRAKLSSVVGANGTQEWLLKLPDQGFSVFDLAGHLIRRIRFDGAAADYVRQGTVLTITSRTSGRQLVWDRVNESSPNFGYDRVTLPDGLQLQYDMNRASLVRGVTFPDQTSKSYLYNEPTLTGATFTTSWLTGVIDEKGNRRATYAYNGSLAVSTELAGGVDKFNVFYGNSFASVTPPQGGAAHSFYWQVGTNGNRQVTLISKPAGAGHAASTKSFTYDAEGNFASINSFDGTRTCFGNDLARSLEVVRVEGLPPGHACPSVVGQGSVLPSSSRKVHTEWHPDWRIETRVAEPGRITTSIYNGQPDPFAGGAVATCAPTSALLPDGKPIAVLCKRVEQATTDANGAAGFSAVLQSGVPARTTTWTYNQWGQVLTENGPRTDVNDTTTYTYYSDTSFTGEGAAAEGHFMGDLQTLTNPAGRVTRYTKYNKHGQVLESVDPNGVVTTHSYDLRQRLLSTTIGGRTTAYQYDPVGQLKRVTLPDQSWVGYDYDDAHRQTAVYDHKGNRIDYTLDNAGNRIGEQTRDPSGALKRQLARSIDALGRVQQTTGRE